MTPTLALLWPFAFAAVVGAAADPPAALSQQPQWQRQLAGEDAKKGKVLVRAVESKQFKDDYPGAIRAAEDLVALRIRVQGESHHETVSLKAYLVNLGKVAALDTDGRARWRSTILSEPEADDHEVAGQYDRALRMRMKILGLRKDVLGDDHPDVAASYNSIAVNLSGQLKPSEALVYAEKALSIYRKAFGDDHPDTATAYTNAGQYLDAAGRATDAAPYHKSALAIFLRVRGNDHPDTALAHSNYASHYESLGDSSASLPHAQAALEICRRTLGELDTDTANSYFKVAVSLFGRGDYESALPPMRRALEVRRLFLGERNATTAVTYSGLAAILQHCGRPAEGLPLAVRAAEIFQHLRVGDHPEAATVYSNLAVILDDLGESVRAQPHHEAALEMRLRIYRGDHSATVQSYSSIGLNLLHRGRTDAAQKYVRDAVAMSLRLFSEMHQLTAKSYVNLAGVLAADGRHREAEPFHRGAHAINLRLLPEGHPEIAKSFNNLGMHCLALNMPDDAQPLLERGLELNRRSFGANHPSTATSHNNLAGVKEVLGRLPDALVHYRMALDICKRTLGEAHPDTLRSHVNLAYCQYGMGNEADAVDSLRRAVSSYEASRLKQAVGIGRASIGLNNPRRLLAVIDHARDPGAAWNHVELAMARGLLDHVTKSETLSTPEEYAAAAAETRRLEILQSQIAAFVAKKESLTARDTIRFEQLCSDRRQAEERLSILGVNASVRRVAESGAIRAVLPVDGALIYWIDVIGSAAGVHEHWACIVRGDGDPKWERLPGTGPDNKWTKDDSSLPGKVRNALAERVPGADLPILVEKLRAQRIAPVLKHLGGVKTLYVVPVHEMAGIPVEALTQEFTVSYIPSGTYLARLKDRPKPAGTSILAVGDPVFDNPNAAKSKGPKRVPPGGLLLTTVLPGGAAANVGLKTGDVLLMYGGVELTSLKQLTAAMAGNATANTVPVTVWRETEEKPLILDPVPGKLGVVLAMDPAPVAVGNRHKTEAVLRAVRDETFDDLPGARVEIDRLKKLFGDDAKVFTDGAASEPGLEALRKANELTKYRYLHFATHGKGNSVRAFDSALILAQDRLPKEFVSKQGEPYLNGQLSASEVLEFWKLDAELVTLSACETAVGKNGGGDGPLGFAQAFLSAGARSVCLSLWKVDDAATVLLMSRFYENLLGKRDGLTKPMGKAAALDEAKRWLRELSPDDALKLSATLTKGVVRGDRGPVTLKNAPPPAESQSPPAKGAKPYAHPKYWAAFVLIGDPN